MNDSHVDDERTVKNADQVAAGTRSTEVQSRGCRRWLYLSIASVFFVLGFLGALLPGLPATPFLLLTSYFLVRSSPALNEKLLRSRFIGPILVDWQVHGGVTSAVKVKAIVIVIIAVGLTLYFTGTSFWPRLAICSLAFVGVVVICRLPKAEKGEAMRVGGRSSR